MEVGDGPDTIRSARQLLSGRCQGVLATQSVEYPGYPFGSVLPYSLGRNSWPLILISHLAQHTRNLDTTPACSLTVTAAGHGDIQKRARLTCLAAAEPLEKLDRGQAERHFRYFPESRAYYEQLSFRFYQLQPRRFYWVSGFGTARWIGTDRMQMDNPFPYAEEEQALQQLNQRLTANEKLAFSPLVAKAKGIDPDSPLQAVGLDPDGLDLRQRDRLLRWHFAASTASLAEALEKLAKPDNNH